MISAFLTAAAAAFGLLFGASAFFVAFALVGATWRLISSRGRKGLMARTLGDSHR